MALFSANALSHTSSAIITAIMATPSCSVSSRNDTIHLTNLSQHVKILANKETHELGNRKANHLFGGMDTARKEEAKRNALLVCRQMGWRAAKNHVEIHLRDIQSGTSDQRANTSDTQQTTEDKKKASVKLADNDDDPPTFGERQRGP